MGAGMPRPELNDEHRYAVGARVEGGSFCPFQSYDKRDKLEEGYADWYKSACAKGLCKPIIVEKYTPARWDEAGGTILRGIMDKVINERGLDPLI